MMGKKAIESAKIFVEESGIADQLTPEAFLEEREGMLQDLFPNCEQMPGEQIFFMFFTFDKNYFFACKLFDEMSH